MRELYFGEGKRLIKQMFENIEQGVSEHTAEEEMEAKHVTILFENCCSAMGNKERAIIELLKKLGRQVLGPNWTAEKLKIARKG